MASSDAPSGTPGLDTKTIVEIAGICLTIIVVLAYPIGFATFSLQMMSNYEFSISTALYAVTLVPGPQVVARILVVLHFAIFPIVATLLYFLIKQHYSTSTTWQRAVRRFSLFFMVFAVLTALYSEVDPPRITA